MTHFTACATEARFSRYAIAPNNGPTYSRSQICGASTVLNNGIALGLDALSLGADFFGPEEQYAKLGTGLTLSTGAMINSAAHHDITGTGLGMASYLKAPTEMAAKSAGWGWGKYIPFAGLVTDAYSSKTDYDKMMSDYSDCMEQY